MAWVTEVVLFRRPLRAEHPCTSCAVSVVRVRIGQKGGVSRIHCSRGLRVTDTGCLVLAFEKVSTVGSGNASSWIGR
jgi:hypothetical protein